MTKRLFPTALAAVLAGLPAALAAQDAAQDAAPVQLSLEHRMLIRCSAAFAIVASGQENGNEQALTFPPMDGTGREFFVRSSAQVMDEAGLGREQISAALSAEAQQLWDEDLIDEVMPVCLRFLEASGL